jgi:hypothetical protein
VKKTSWFEYLSPVFLAIFPILSLALENIEFIKLGSFLRSVIIAVVVVGAFDAIIYLLLKDQRKAGILAGLIVFLLLTYGNVYLALEERMKEPVDHGLLLVFYLVVIILVGVLIVRVVKDARELNLAIFFGGLAIVGFLLFSIGLYEYRVFNSEARSADADAQFQTNLTDEEISALPDIYLILLDGHTRSDVLRDVYDYDNSEFTSQLEEMGFWVADCSLSNYPGTNFSTGALFEMDYLHNVYEDLDNLVFPSLNETAVFQILDNHHYSTVSFHNFLFEHFNITDDIRLAKEDKLFGSINEFEKMAVDTSILKILIDMEGAFPRSWVIPFEDDFYLTHYRDTMYALDALPDLPNMDGPKFVYAHILVTHDPFVFNPDGSYKPSKKITGVEYRDSVEFIDNTLPDIVEEIIRKSDTPPIILIMGDHGAIIKGRPIEERMSILFSIYLQGNEPLDFYPEITPVNVFKLIFNHLFDADYELVEDRSYEIWDAADLGDYYLRVFPQCKP